MHALLTVLLLSQIPNSGSLHEATPPPKSLVRSSPSMPVFVAQGIRLGDRPPAAYVAANGMTQEDLSKSEFFRTHRIPLSHGEARQYLSFQYGYLATCSITFDPEDFGEVVAIFSQRLGKPAQRRKEPVSNGFGATFDNEIALWQTDAGLFKLSKYGNKLDHGFGFIASQSYLQNDKAQRKVNRADAANRF